MGPSMPALYYRRARPMSNGGPVTTQERLAIQLHDEDPTNHLNKDRLGWLAEGALDRDALRRALAAVIARNSALRTWFHTAGGRWHRVVDPPPLRVAIEHVDVSGVADADHDARLRALSGELARAPFDLGRAPL